MLCVLVVCVVCVRCVVCVYCVVLWHAETSPCVNSKRPRVYRHHAHMCYRAWCRYTQGSFESTHGGFLDGHTGERG